MKREARAHFIWTQRRLLAREQAGPGGGVLCAHCGRWHACSDDMELSHRIADTKPNRRRYGVNIVDHVFNKALVCPGLRGGVSCNDAMNCGNKPATAAALVRRIRGALEREGGLV